MGVRAWAFFPVAHDLGFTFLSLTSWEEKLNFGETYFRDPPGGRRGENSQKQAGRPRNQGWLEVAWKLEMELYHALHDQAWQGPHSRVEGRGKVRVKVIW